MRAVRFDKYGGVDVLEVREVDDPVSSDGRVVVAVRAAGINPGEATIREGLLHERWPATFPSGQGSDFAGVVQAVGAGVTTVSVGDEVLGWSHERSSHAELLSVPADQVVPKTPTLSWEIAGGLFVAGMAALGGVGAVRPKEGETVAVSAAAGGVGSLTAQLARRTGARVLGLASERNHEWLRSHDIVPVAYGDGQVGRLREAAGGKLDAFIDTFGGGYVEDAISLGVTPERINTIIDWDAAAKHTGVQLVGTTETGSAARLTELAELAADGSLEVPIAASYPLDRVQDAFRELAERHTRGKIVLIP